MASYACGYPDSPTRLLREVPQAPFGTQIFNLWLRVHLRPKSRLRRLASETLSAESVRTLLTATGSPLAVVFFFLLWFGLLHRQDPIHIVLDRQQLPHGGAGLPVLAVSRFLVCQQLGILGLKLLDGGQFLHVQFVKGFLGGLVQQDFFLVFLPEFL